MKVLNSIFPDDITNYLAYIMIQLPGVVAAGLACQMGYILSTISRVLDNIILIWGFQTRAMRNISPFNISLSLFANRLSL